MPNVIRLLFGNIQTLVFAGFMLYSVLRRTSAWRRLWRWFWS